MSDFASFAKAHGLILEELRADDQWHRTRTEDKPKRRNGAYIFDGRRGVVINFATMANGVVWRDGTNAGHIDRASIRAQRLISEAQKRAKHDEARKVAAEMMASATVGPHPYLAAKGFHDEKGLVLNDELLIPMREFRLYKTVNSIQRIAADGSKLFLPGGKAKGSVYFIGSYVASERWLVEGYATGLSVRAALRALYRDAQVVVCFSAGNLAYMGRLVKDLRPVAYVMADNDESGAGVRAAEETGLLWAMPPQVGDDANDLHKREGLNALVKLIRTVRARADERAA